MSRSLNPVRMWIDGKCYNIRKYDRKKYDCVANVVNESVDEEIKQFSRKIRLPSIYYSKLVKYRNPQVDSVQNETNTIIKYPTDSKGGLLEIYGKSTESIEVAEEQMYSFIADIRHQLSALQFISIPLLSDEIKQNFEEFKKEILIHNYPGVEESIFQSALKLHLTIVVFTLFGQNEKQHALNVLEEIKTIIPKTGKPLRIRAKGINCMNANLSKVNVLYANVSFTEDSNSEESLQKISNEISNIFYEKGLCREAAGNVKLHMTLMNTKYRNKKGKSSKKKWVKKEPFDATEIMEKFKDFHFGDAVFDTICLSLMSSKGEDGFYKSIGSIKI